MATILPMISDAQLRKLRSQAEATVYRLLQKLPEAYVILHQLETLLPGKNQALREGEIDFLILHPSRGLLVLEVKGGGIQQEVTTGVWWSVDRYGKRHAIRDPFQQARSSKHTLLEYIRSHGKWASRSVPYVSIHYAVLFPDVDSVAEFDSPAHRTEIMGCRRTLQDLENWINHIFDSHDPMNNKIYSPSDRAIIESILCAPLTMKPRLSVSFDHEEELRSSWTDEQWKIVGGLRQNPHIIVEGAAGTGKTLLAVRWAQEAALKGQRVLLLCFNRPLAQLLKRENQQFMKNNGLSSSVIGMMSFYDFALYWIKHIDRTKRRDLVKEAKQSHPGKSEPDVQIPFALALAIEEELPPYDVLVVDEAQDFGDEYWGALSPLIYAGRSAMFWDPNQAIFRSAEPSFKAARYILTQNCRNTEKIHEASFRFYLGPEVSPPELKGHEITVLQKNGVQAQACAIFELVRDLIENEGLRPHDIAVLVLDSRSKHQAYEALEQAFGPSIRLSREEHFIPDQVLCDTVARFKGMEALVVILWLGHKVDTSSDQALLYVALSRARSLLCLVGTKEACSAVMPQPS